VPWVPNVGDSRKVVSKQTCAPILLVRHCTGCTTIEGDHHHVVPILGCLQSNKAGYVKEKNQKVIAIDAPKSFKSHHCVCFPPSLTSQIWSDSLTHESSNWCYCAVAPTISKQRVGLFYYNPKKQKYHILIWLSFKTNSGYEYSNIGSLD